MPSLCCDGDGALTVPAVSLAFTPHNECPGVFSSFCFNRVYGNQALRPAVLPNEEPIPIKRAIPPLFTERASTTSEQIRGHNIFCGGGQHTDHLTLQLQRHQSPIRRAGSNVSDTNISNLKGGHTFPLQDNNNSTNKTKERNTLPTNLDHP